MLTGVNLSNFPFHDLNFIFIKVNQKCCTILNSENAKSIYNSKITLNIGKLDGNHLTILECKHIQL